MMGFGLIRWLYLNGGGMIVDLMLLSCQSLHSHEEGSLQAYDHIAVSSRLWERFLQKGLKDQASNECHPMYFRI